MIVKTIKRIRELELRWTENIVTKEEYMEIVIWRARDTGSEFCFSLLIWNKKSEGWELRFVGDRPFGYEVDHDLLWSLMRYGQDILDAEFRLSESIAL